MASVLKEVRRISVPRAVIGETLAVLKSFGDYGYEALVLWLGRVEGDRAFVTHAYAPPQHPITGEDGVGYFVTSETLFRLNQALAEHRLRLIAQVHSHPNEAYHSSADDRYAIVTEEGGLSLVVPDFGVAPPDPAVWAVYRLLGRDWVDVDPRDARALLDTVPFHDH